MGNPVITKDNLTYVWTTNAKRKDITINGAEVTYIVDEKKPQDNVIYKSAVIGKPAGAENRPYKEMQRLKETTGFPKSDSGFSTATVTLSPTLSVVKRLLRIFLSFSITKASVFAPISTKISPDVSLVMVPVTISPFLTEGIVVLTDFIKSAIVVACLLDDF